MSDRRLLLAMSCVIALACSAVTSKVTADDDYVPEDGSRYNSKAFDRGNAENFILGEKALKAGHTEKAIEYLRKSVAQNGDDFDARVAYATALEDKYRAQDEKDQSLFRECVAQWLYVLKTVAPEEKGVSVLKFLYKDDERDMPAKVHIKNLTGTLPKPFETQKMFLARVCKGESTVSGSIVRKAPKIKREASEDAAKSDGDN